MSPSFSASFCDPFKSNIVEFGELQGDHISEQFEIISWEDLLKRMESAKEAEIFYSPSFEVENKETMHGLSISAVGIPDNYEFYIFYKRPKKVKTFLGLKEKIIEDYITNITGQTKQNALDCLNALLRNDIEYLADKIGR